MTERSPSYHIYGYAAFITIVLWLVVYPGFMSYDSLHALREARGSVAGGSYPPFVSYVWRPLDRLWPGPSAMLLVQNGLLLLASAHILRLLQPSKAWQAYLALFVLALLPPLLGPMLVVWKDVAVGASYAVTIAAALHIREGVGVTTRRIAVGIAILSAFCGMAFRFNAASAALPLLIFLFWRLPRATSTSTSPARHPIFPATIAATAVVAILFGLVHLMNSFRLPDFQRLAPNTGFAAIAAFDVIGMSKHTGNPIEVQTPNGKQMVVSADVADSIYDPRHLNITLANLANAAPEMDAAFKGLNWSRDVVDLWLRGVTSDPAAYLAHRARVGQVLVGAHAGPQFYPTHNSVDPNDLGISQSPNALNQGVVRWVVRGVDGLGLRPWTIYLAMTLLLPVFLLRGTNRALVATLAASSLLYLVPLIFILPAGDMRYNFWSVTSAALCLVAGLIARRQRDGEQPH
ncbi:MAG: hypothetical protein OEV08_04135 [Nitrospira sp.]|nr:hypothetical protein [Nitrospira sp.]